MPNDRLARALDDSIARLKAGASLEDCLTAHVDVTAELKPLLAAAERLRRVAPERFPEEMRGLARNRLMAGVARPAAAPMNVKPRFNLSWGRALLVPLTAVAIVLGLFLGLSTSQGPDSAEAATILTVLQGEVSVHGAKASLVVRTRADLRPGDRVITGPGARAVLTFLDGSTVALGPDTEVLIKAVVDQQGTVRVRLKQERGQTWTNVTEGLGSRQIEIETPTGEVGASEAAFSTSVEPSSGRTEVGAGSGSLQVRSGNQRTDVTGGAQTSVDAPGVVAPATASSPPPRELVLRISGPAWGYVTDPSGATIGLLAPGYPVNQVPGATASRDGANILIRIPQPAAGTYTIGLHGVSGGIVQLGSALSGVSDTASVAVSDGQDWSIALAVDAQAVAFGPPTLQSRAAAKPANVAIPDRVIAAATAISAKPEATKTAKPPTPTPTPTRTPTKPAQTPVSFATPVRATDATVDSAGP